MTELMKTITTERKVQGFMKNESEAFTLPSGFKYTNDIFSHKWNSNCRNTKSGFFPLEITEVMFPSNVQLAAIPQSSKTWK